jgi:hypothetical protein
MISPPNNWAPGAKSWVVTANTAIELWGQLQVVDALGTRPYVAPLGSVLQVVFQRGDFIGSTTNKQLTVSKQAALNVDFRALFKINLTAAEATNVISGTAVFTLTSGSDIQTWTQNWFVQKLNTSAGF